jgi:predicted kinase
MKSLQLETPHAIVMIGIPGSGKSFFARKFSEMFKAPLIEQAVLEPLVADDQALSKLIGHMLGELTKGDRSIVLEVDTATRQARTELAKVLKNAGFRPLFIWVQTDAETARVRSAKARMPAEEHARLTKRFASPTPAENALVISGKHTYATQAKIVLKKLTESRAQDSASNSAASGRGRIIVR